ncbi:MAG: hypothetical protein ACLGIW_08075 [Gammaproteobacteria bacterium]
MNNTLKSVANIGAELAAAKAEFQLELERHRKTWRQLERVRGLLQRILNTPRGTSGRIIIETDEEAEIRAALSQKAEPLEPAPAQDEREAFEAEMGYAGRSRDLRNDYVNEAIQHRWEGFQAGAEWQRTRPAQTEQQPVAFANLKEMELCMHRPAEGEWIPVYAAPIAQTATQPELVMPVALGSVNADYDKGWADHAAEVVRLNAALSAQG